METEPIAPLAVVAISGYAGAGKDTLADGIQHYLVGAKTERVKMADELKEGINQYLRYIGLPEIAFTEDRALKAILRPLLVEAGKYARSQDKAIFAKLATGIMRGAAARGASVVFVTDLRYLNEFNVLRDTCLENGWRYMPVYVRTAGVLPANDEERDSIAELLLERQADMLVLDFEMGVFDRIDEAAQALAIQIR
jgi:hypothetical protein